MIPCSAVLFAGGKSSRMGRDKALLPFGGFGSLSAFGYHKLSHLFERCYLSAKENKFDFECEIIVDKYKESSPLVGIISLFETLEEESVFILSVDTPLLDEATIRTLWEAHQKERSDITIAQSPHGLHPLCGFYRRSILPLAFEQYHQNNHKLQHLLNLANTQTVLFESERLFTNLNYFEEYQATRKSHSREMAISP